MGWDGADAETIARDIYARAHEDMSEPISPGLLAKRLGLDVRTAPRRGPWGDATRVRLGARWSIWTAPKLSQERRRFAIAHELAEHALRDSVDAGVEDFANAIAAAVLAPRGLFAGAVGVLGEDLEALAKAFVATQSCMAMRIGEVLWRPIALVAPAIVRVRGESWEWGHEEAIRKLSRMRDLPPEVLARRLTDEPRRVLLIAA